LGRLRIQNNSQPGDAVYDPFVGSGTTIIVAEMSGRKCLAIEINAAYRRRALLSGCEADKILTRHIEGALDPNNEGKDVKSAVSLAGDELKLSSVVPATGRIDTVFRREGRPPRRLLY
jgi:hypothetical protein